MALWSPGRNQDLKEMLESNKESLKLEAMKRIVGVSASREVTLFEFFFASAVTEDESSETANGWSCFAVCFVLSSSPWGRIRRSCFLPL